MVPDWTPVAKNLTRVAWRPSTIAYNPVNLRFGWNVKDWSMRCDRPDVAVDEEHDPEADVASFCPVELLQRQKREKSRP